MSKERRGSWFLTLIGVLLVLTSLGHMDSLLYWSRYQKEFSFLPELFVVIRYAGSWTQRVLGLFAGIGLICRNELSRRVIIALSVFNIITAYWKHPYDVFYQEMLKQRSTFEGALAQNGVAFDPVSLAWTVTISAVIFEVVTFGFLVWYLQRASIKEEFLNKRDADDIE